MDPSSFDDPSYQRLTRAPLYVGLDVTIFVLALSTSVLRGYVRIFLLKASGWDDYILFASMACFMWLFSMSMVDVSLGFGRHFLPASINITPFLKGFFIESIAYITGLTLVKCSLGLLILRFCITKTQIWIIRVTLILGTTIGICTTFVLLTVCQPLNFSWSTDAAARAAHCYPITVWLPINQFHIVKNIVVDLVYALVPIWIIVQTTMHWRVKLAVCLILACGSLSLVGTIARLPFINEAHYNGNYDPLWSPVWLALTSTAEFGIAIFACNIATLRPLFKRFFGDESSRRGLQKAMSTPSCVVIKDEESAIGKLEHFSLEASKPAALDLSLAQSDSTEAHQTSSA